MENNSHELSDKDMVNYVQCFEKNMQMFETNIAKGGIFQGCTINNPIFNITIKK